MCDGYIIPHFRVRGPKFIAQDSAQRHTPFRLDSNAMKVGQNEQKLFKNSVRNVQTDWSGFHPAMFYPLSSLPLVW